MRLPRHGTLSLWYDFYGTSAYPGARRWSVGLTVARSLTLSLSWWGRGAWSYRRPTSRHDTGYLRLGRLGLTLTRWNATNATIGGL